MALHEPVHNHGPKSLREGAVCFGCAIVALATAAVVLQWAMGLLV